MDTKFTHLHLHTEYSLLDGLSKIKPLIRHVKEQGMDSVAITDHGVMCGVVDFYKEAKKEGVKPIIGMEAYTTNVPHNEKVERSKVQNYHLLLLAKDLEGYQNLMKLSSIAHLEGFYYRPRFDLDTLAKYSKGLIATSACPLGEVGQNLINDEYDKAKELVKWYSQIFGRDYYLEIQRHDFERWAKESKISEIKSDLLRLSSNNSKWETGIIKLSRELGIPLVATNDAHYIKASDAPAQDALVCVATGKVVTDIKRMRYIDTPDFYVKSPKEMMDVFSDLPDSIENTNKVAEKCDLELVLGKWFFPNFPLEKGETPDNYLRNLARKKLEEKIPNFKDDEINRLNHELDIICTKGYAPYFLIVMDMVNWAGDNGVVTNTRGSAAGSLVSYVLGITTVNPLTYYLPFERFLNPYRPSPPDIDFDVSDSRREDVIKYISDKYGHDKVAQICTFGRMLSRAAVRDVARVLGYPYAVGDKIAKLIPPPKQGFPITIPKALSEVPELKSLYDSDPDTQKVIDLATQIEGNARHVSVHAAGVVIAQSLLTDYAPVQKEPSGEKVITQYEFHNCEEVGLIKIDVLGIRNLSILGDAINLVKERRGIDVKLSKMPLDDKKTFEMLSRGETMGVFQLGGSGMTKYLKDLKPERVEDLMAMVALYRPGPISQIPEYIKRKNNPKSVKYLDPRMEKFLGSSYGLIVYQDDLLFCALDLAGYTWEEADKFRKAVGKKIPEEMAAQKDKFVSGIIANGQTKEFAEELWKLFEPFQSYGFNKAHAASYGIVAYQTAYMKANFPVEYMASLLTAESNDIEKVTQAVHECGRMGIKVLPPDINESNVDFTIVEDKNSLDGLAIRFGLSAIKNVGKAAIEAIIEARSHEFETISDFLTRVDGRRVNKKVLESLIKVGAMSRFGNRATLLNNLDTLRNKLTKPKSLSESQQGLFASDDIKKLESSGGTTELMTNFDEFDDTELQSLERQLLGFSLSDKPLSEILMGLENLASHKIDELSTSEGVASDIKVCGLVTEIRIAVTKKTGQEMAFVKLKDSTGVIDLVVFPKIFQAAKELLVDGKVLLVAGRLDSKSEEPALLVSEITNTGNLSEEAKKVFIKVPPSAGPDDLRRLKTFLESNPGNKNVSLIFEKDKRKIDLALRIDWNETTAKMISEILDPASPLH